MVPRESDRRFGHWNGLYSARAEDAFGWFQAVPDVSLRLIAGVAPGLHGPIVDVGAGESRLADALLASGATDLTLVDVSRVALDAVATRLGDSGARVHFVRADVLEWTPDRSYAVWHDRAVFHFLTEAKDRVRYLDTVANAVPTGGHLVLGTFASDGPATCSGLPACRYTAEDLAAMAAPRFTLVADEREVHITPRGDEQPFTWVVLERR